MNEKKRQAAYAMIEYIDNYYCENRHTPSLREIEAKLGFSRQSALRYLQKLDREGVVKYDGKSIVTSYIEKLTYYTVRQVQIVGPIPCGTSTVEEQMHGEFVSIPSEWLGDGRYFVLRASGDSMIESGISDGDLVVIEQTDRAEYGQIVAALDENNGSTLKRLVYDKKKKRLVLHPENSSMKDICPDEIVVQGVAVKVIKDLP